MPSGTISSVPHDRAKAFVERLREQLATRTSSATKNVAAFLTVESSGSTSFLTAAFYPLLWPNRQASIVKPFTGTNP
jgi:hypothetical protein